MMLFFTFWVCNKPGMGTSRIDYVLCSTSIVSAIQFRWPCTPLHFQTLYVRPVLVPHYISCKLCFRICSVHSAAIITTFVTSNWSKKNREACRAEVVLATIYITPALRILIEVHQHQGTFTLWTRWVTVVHMLMLATSIGNIWQSSPIIGPSECWHLQMLVTCETKITWSYKWPKDRVMYLCEAKFTCSCKRPRANLCFTVSAQTCLSVIPRLHLEHDQNNRETGRINFRPLVNCRHQKARSYCWCCSQ